MIHWLEKNQVGDSCQPTVTQILHKIASVLIFLSLSFSVYISLCTCGCIYTYQYKNLKRSINRSIDRDIDSCLHEQRDYIHKQTHLTAECTTQFRHIQGVPLVQSPRYQGFDPQILYGFQGCTSSFSSFFMIGQVNVFKHHLSISIYKYIYT